ncbi:hypothetical protein LTR62_007419 [Meristemomyces frigidus]|uniref:Major facilitator superfamily (MFS) profile domain-containing protein n=1 Tax=Meristemomyces frigidus TaxID=1508187 RepID=A0AAN7YJ73_9PEZI|nr:hypothetical protein LTR62_007419 [Meristemomyces frigidus]
MPAYILFGWNNAVAGPLLDLPSWVQTFPRIDTANTTGAQSENNARVQGTVVAMYTLGAFFGSLSCIWIGDKLGRKRTIQLGAAIEVVGALLQASSFSLAQLIVGRLVTGFGFGALTVKILQQNATAPNWQSECASASHRGAAVLLESLFISAGLALSAWVNLGMSFTNGSVSWRFPLAMSGFWGLIVVAVVPLLPESPRWLLKRGRTAEAIEVMSALEGVAEDDPVVRAELAEMAQSLQIAGQSRFLDVFKNGELRLFNRLCLACAGQMFQQQTGINALAFYVTTIFQTYLGLNGVLARILGASVFTFQTICSPIGVLTVDKLGRRKLMMIAAFGMGTCMAVVAGTSSQRNSTAAVAVAGAFIFLFSLFFPVGFLGLTFLYASEISPLSVRVPITSMSTGTAWLFNFLVAEVTPVGFATLGWRYYIVWACINFFLILPSVYFFFPETNGRHLEEVDQIFRDSHNIFQPVKEARRLPSHGEPQDSLSLDHEKA